MIIVIRTVMTALLAYVAIPSSRLLPVLLVFCGGIATIPAMAQSDAQFASTHFDDIPSLREQVLAEA